MTSGPGWELGPDDRGAQPPKMKPDEAASPKPKIRLEKRAGKTVTVIAGLHTYGSERLNGMAREWKTEFGTGGTVKNGEIEIQGDFIQAVKGWFQKSKRPGEHS